MTQKIDGYLSRRLQAWDRSALVTCDVAKDGTERWRLTTGDADYDLGPSFRAARSAVEALLKSKGTQHDDE